MNSTAVVVVVVLLVCLSGWFIPGKPTIKKVEPKKEEKYARHVI